MRNKDTVFWLTLVDFLIQIIFFGLFAAVIFLAANQKPEAPVSVTPEPERTENSAKVYAQAAGYSSVAELTDDLTRMVPADKFTAFAEAVAGVGGAAEVETWIKKKKKSDGDGGLGWRSCEPGSDGRSYQSIAKIRAYDDRIEFEQETPALRKALDEIGVSFESVRVLRISDFKRKLQPLAPQRRKCVYYLDVERHYQFAYVVDAIEGIFAQGRRTGGR